MTHEPATLDHHGGGDTSAPRHGWRLARLDSLCKIRHGGTPRKEVAEFWRGDIPWASPKDMWADVLQHTQDHISEAALEHSATNLVTEGALLVVIRSGILARRLPIAIAARDLAYNQDIKALLPDRASIDPAFLFYALRSAEPTILAHGVKKGATVHSLKSGYLEALPVPIPPLAEQRRIAARLREQLAEVAKARAAVQAQLTAAEGLHAALLRAAFSNSAVQRWPVSPLVETSEISGGVTLGRDIRGRPTRRVPYLRVANVKDGWLDLSQIKEVEATEREISDCRLEFGDILLTEGGDPDKLGRGTYWQEQIPECIHQNHIFRVRFDLAAFDPAFLAFQFGSPYGKAYFLAHAKQTTGIACINRTVLSKFPLLVPPAREQQKVAAELLSQKETAIAILANLRDRLAALERLPAALLRDAFGGKL